MTLTPVLLSFLYEKINFGYDELIEISFHACQKSKLCNERALTREQRNNVITNTVDIRVSLLFASFLLDPSFDSLLLFRRFKMMLAGGCHAWPRTFGVCIADREVDFSFNLSWAGEEAC